MHGWRSLPEKNDAQAETARMRSAGTWQIDSLRLGSARPLGPRAVPSGIHKEAVAQSVLLTSMGFVGDEQGDRHHHGGHDKAVHQYPHEHYAAWLEEIEDHPLLRSAGAFGENLSITGLSEINVAVGDRFALGGAIIEVSQGRQPCFRLNLRFERRGMALAMQLNGRTGWYYRVLQQGIVGPSDRLRLLDRLTPSWTIDRLHRILYLDAFNRHELRGMVALVHLSHRWRLVAERRLHSGVLEDWTRRLEGA